MYCATRRHAGVLVSASVPVTVLASPRRCVSLRTTPVDLDAIGVADTVALLEAAAIALGAATLDAERLDLARSTGTALRQCSDDAAAAAGLARQFHRTLLMGCPNTHMLELIDLQTAGARRARTLVPVGVGELTRVADDHEAILDMIATGASAGDVERRLRQHAGHSPLCAAR